MAKIVENALKTFVFAALSMATLALTALPAGAQTAFDWDLSRHWDVTIGAGGLWAPNYEGSDNHKLSPIPYFDFEWNGRFSLSSTDGLHLAIIKWQDLSIGLAGDARLPRNSSDDRALNHLGRVGLSIETGGYIDYNPRGFDISIEARHDIAGGHGGTVVEFNARGQLEFGKFGVEFGPNVNWASKSYMQSYFGINNAQAASSGYAPYNIRGGFKNVGFTVDGQYKFDEHWRIGFEADYARLLDSAAKSPLVRSRGSADQYTFSTVIAYHF